MAPDEYGRTPQYVRGDTPGSKELRDRMVGRVLVARPEPVPLPAFTNDQPET